MPVSIAQLVATVTIDASGFEQGMTSINVSMQSLVSQSGQTTAQVSQQWAAMGAMATRIGHDMEMAGAAILGSLGMLVKSGADYNQTIQQVGANTTMTAAEIQKMDQAVRDLGSHSAAPLDSLAKGFMHLVNLGISAADAPKALEIAMKSAVSTGGNVEKTAEMLGVILHNFHLNAATDSARTMALLHQAAAQGNQTLEQFVGGTSRAYAMAAQYHISLVDVTAALSAMTRAGFSASVSTTQFTGMINSILTPSKAAHKELVQLSKESGMPDLVRDFSAFGIATKGVPAILNELAESASKAHHPLAQVVADVFTGQRGRIMAGALLNNNRDDFNEIKTDLSKKFAGQEDPTEGAYKNAMQQLSNQIKEFKNDIDVLGADIEKALLPVLLPVLDWAKEAIHWFTDLPQPVKETAVALTGLAGAGLLIGGALLSTVGSITSLVAGAAVAGITLEGISAAFTGVAAIITGPVGIAIGLGIAAITALGVAWSQNWGHIREKTYAFIDWAKPYLQTTWNTIKEQATHAWNGIKDFLLDVWVPVKSAFLGIWDFLKSAATDVWSALTAIFEGTGKYWIEMLTGIWEMIKGIFHIALNVIGGIIVVALDLITGNWTDAWNNIDKYAKRIADGIGQTIGGLGHTLVGLFSGIGKSLFNAGKAALQSFVDGFRDQLPAETTAMRGMIDALTLGATAPKPPPDPFAPGERKVSATHLRSPGESIDMDTLFNPPRNMKEFMEPTTKGFPGGWDMMPRDQDKVDQEQALADQQAGLIKHYQDTAGATKAGEDKMTAEQKRALKEREKQAEETAEAIKDTYKKIFEQNATEFDKRRRDALEEYYNALEKKVPEPLAAEAYAGDMKSIGKDQIAAQKEAADKAKEAAKETSEAWNKAYQSISTGLQSMAKSIDKANEKLIEQRNLYVQMQTASEAHYAAIARRVNQEVEDTNKAQLKEAQKEIEQMDVIAAYQFKTHEMTGEEYKAWLKSRLGDYEKYSQDWMKITDELAAYEKQKQADITAADKAYQKQQQDQYQDLATNLKSLFTDVFTQTIEKGKNFFNVFFTDFQQMLLKMAEAGLQKTLMTDIAGGLDALFPQAGGVFTKVWTGTNPAAPSLLPSGASGVFGIGSPVPFVPSNSGALPAGTAFNDSMPRSAGAATPFAPVIHFNVTTNDATSFQYSEHQIQAQLARAVEYSRQRNNLR